MTEQKVPKKRGRKPKGGRIISKIETHSSVLVPEPNIVILVIYKTKKHAKKIFKLLNLQIIYSFMN